MEFTLGKSGYQVARQMLKEDDWTECSSGPSGQRVWSKLWHLRVPNKIKVFGWRACLEILPTRVNLARRRIIPDNMCHCCKRSLKQVCMCCGSVMLPKTCGRGVWSGFKKSLMAKVTLCSCLRSLWSGLQS